MKSEELDAIFRPFNKVNPNFSKGIGLGLAISWRLIALMDGWLDVFAAPGKGTELHVWIPISVPVANSRLQLAQSQDHKTTETNGAVSHSDPLAEMVSVIENIPDLLLRQNLIDSIELMDAEMVESTLHKLKDQRLEPLKNAAKSRNFSMLIALNERLHPLG
jgi:hypothetical protein